MEYKYKMESKSDKFEQDPFMGRRGQYRGRILKINASPGPKANSGTGLALVWPRYQG